MATKYYKVNGNYYTWNQLHNQFGYTDHATTEVTYKSGSDIDWGSDGGSGYYDGDIDAMMDGLFWCDSDIGWFDLENLLWNPEIYPSSAINTQFQRGDVVSDAVYITSDSVDYYLIRKDFNAGWMTLDEVNARGWGPVEETPPAYFVFDTTTNEIVLKNDAQYFWGEVEGIVLPQPKYFIGLPQSVPEISFYFTNQGQNATTDNIIRSDVSVVTLRDAAGQQISQDDRTLYDGEPVLSYMKVDGNMFAPETGEVLDDHQGNLCLVPNSSVDRQMWSLQAQKIFRVQFTNPDHPSFVITMPSDETGYIGTSITLPTMTGQYEEGGTLYEPTSWSIGAFGSAYTINRDVAAVLIFSPVQLYPTVSLDGDFGVDNWVYPNAAQTVAAIYAGATSELYDSDGNTHVFDSTKSYAVVQWQVTSGTRAGATQFEIVDVSGNIGVQNRTPNTISLLQVRIAVCSSDQVITVHVYDKSTGVVYNAFKYTDAGVDYYYILDGVQSDWSDDIDSLGFALGDGFTEITLYGNVSSTIACQNNVTSGFTGNVNTANVLQLYTDNTYTTPWNGYDYSNDYEMGVYSSGVWYSRGGTIADLPSTTANPGDGETVSKLFVLLDTGCLWFVCNNSNSGYEYNNQHAYFYGTITIRIYPKGRQNYPAYVYGAADAYSNVSISADSTVKCVRYVSTSIYIQMPTQFPPIFLSKVRGAASNDITLSNFIARQTSSSATEFRITNTTAAAISIRNVVYSLSFPTFYAWVNLTGNTSTSSGTAYPLFDSYGNYIEIDSNFVYYAIAHVKYDGTNAKSVINYLNKSTLGSLDSTHPERLCFKQTYGSLSLSAVWCYRKPSATVSKVDDEYTCSSPLARRITVYDANNVEFGAFWLHLNVDWYYVDYYYVLDDVQTDWTDNLESIGYSLGHSNSMMEVILDLLFTGGVTTFNANDYKGACIASDEDKSALEAFGLSVSIPGTASSYAIDKSNLNNYLFVPIALYNGQTDLNANMANFYCGDVSSSGNYAYTVCIKSFNAYTIQANRWKCRIFKLS